MNKYPFRYVCPKIGQTVYFPVVDSDSNEQVFVGTGKIVDIHDFADDFSGKEIKKEDYLIEYYIEIDKEFSDILPFNHGCIFGVDIFETKEEALEDHHDS